MTEVCNIKLLFFIGIFTIGLRMISRIASSWNTMIACLVIKRRPLKIERKAAVLAIRAQENETTHVRSIWTKENIKLATLKAGC